MNNKKWHEILDKLRPFLFKIFTPNGTGTGFQILHTQNRNFCGIATAYHVIKHAYEWDEPIKIMHNDSQEFIALKESDRVIYAYPFVDLAFILFDKGSLPIKENALKLIEKGNILKQGAETGWCGFPSVAPSNLCFFAGHISSYMEGDSSYLVDGIAIHGVSGGPAFYVKNNEPRIYGVISEYKPNRATGEALPGLCVVKTVKSYYDDLKQIKTLDEAKEEKEVESEEEKKEETSEKEVAKKEVKEENKKTKEEKEVKKKKPIKRKKSVKKAKKRASKNKKDGNKRKK